jgi:hypothetical protein
MLLFCAQLQHGKLIMFVFVEELVVLLFVCQNMFAYVSVFFKLILVK